MVLRGSNGFHPKDLRSFQFSEMGTVVQLPDTLTAFFQQWQLAGLTWCTEQVLWVVRELPASEDAYWLARWTKVIEGVLAHRPTCETMRGLLLVCLYYSPELRLLFFAHGAAAETKLRYGERLNPSSTRG